MSLVQFGGVTLAFFALAAQAAPDPYPSTYQSPASTPVLIRNATVLDGTGRRLDGADVLIREDLGSRFVASIPGPNDEPGAQTE